MSTTDSFTVPAINQALLKIGISRTIADLTEQTEEAHVAGVIYETTLRSVLRHHPWPFATKYALLVLHSGTAETALNLDWQYAYTYPADCLFARRILGANHRRFDENPIEFRMGREGDVRVIYTQCAAPVNLEYTAIFDCPVELVDELFMDALTWKLASAIAPALIKGADGQESGLRALQMYRATMDIAATVSAREEQRDPPGDAEWINARA